MSNQELNAIIEKYNLQDRHDLKWQVGDRVQFIQEEYTWGSGDDKKQDAWIGDTATIVSLYDQHFCQEDDFMMWFDVEIVGVASVLLRVTMQSILIVYIGS